MTTDVLPMIFPDTGLSVRVILRDGEPWWVGRDVCAVLRLANVSQALGRLDEDERGVCLVETPGGDQRLIVINEPGLYSLILRSDKAVAKTFKRWVTHDVLPEIRKTGAFAAPVPPAPFEIPTTLHEALALASQQALLVHEQAEALKVANDLQEMSDRKIAELEPRAEAADAFMTGGPNLLVREVAKLLGMRQKDLYFLLVQKQYLFRRTNSTGEAYYDVMAKHRSAEYFLPKMYKWLDHQRALHVTYTIYVTPKGVEMIRKMLRNLADKGNTPAIRRSQAGAPSPFSPVRGA